VRQVAVGYCLRFLPSARVVKAFLDGGRLGILYNVECNVGQYLPDWRKDKDYKESVSAKKSLGGGALLELSHELDYLHWMLGDLTLQHSWLRVTKELGLDVEEIVDLILTSESGIYINVHLDFIQKSTQRKCEFIGQNGRLDWDLMENTIKFYSSQGVEVVYTATEYDKNKMYIDMLSAFENIEQLGFGELATVVASTKVIKLIEEAKHSNKWRGGV
jgi:predicted dehydrogenase